MHRSPSVTSALCYVHPGAGPISSEAHCGLCQEAAQQGSLVTTATAMEQALGPHLMEEWAEGKSVL